MIKIIADKTVNTLKESKKIAVIGCSRNTPKPAHYVPKYMQNNGYRIIPVNPFASKILGEESFESIMDVQEKVEIINIFRPSNQCYEIMQKIIKLSFKPKLIWMQLGIINEKAKKLAEDNGIPVVQNKCIMVEHQKIK